MKYCSECGEKLILKEVEHEGVTPYCKNCQKLIFPTFNVAVSLIALSPDEKHILLIQQYGKQRNILVAGYVNQKENVEETILREMQEEIGRKVIQHRFLKSSYFAKSNTLMLNFVVKLDDDSLQDVSDWEVDHAAWYSFEEASQAIAQGSLAQQFLLNFFAVYKQLDGHIFTV